MIHSVVDCSSALCLFKIFFSLLTLSTAFLQKACGPGKNILPSCTQKSVVIDYLKTQFLDFVLFYL